MLENLLANTHVIGNKEHRRSIEDTGVSMSGAAGAYLDKYVRVVYTL
jgi:hypothetical protein